MIKKKAVFEYWAYESLYIVTKDSGQDMYIRPKLGLQYLCEVLEKKGIKINTLEQLVKSFNPLSFIKSLTDYDIVGFYAHPRNLMRMAYFVLKNPGGIVTRGLKHPSLLAWAGFIKRRYT